MISLQNILLENSVIRHIFSQSIVETDKIWETEKEKKKNAQIRITG